MSFTQLQLEDLKLHFFCIFISIYHVFRHTQPEKYIDFPIFYSRFVKSGFSIFLSVQNSVHFFIEAKNSSLYWWTGTSGSTVHQKKSTLHDKFLENEKVCRWYVLISSHWRQQSIGIKIWCRKILQKLFYLTDKNYYHSMLILKLKISTI